MVAEIQRLIAAGQLAPGMKLPPEREFAEQLGVSRTVVREAVHILTAKGLLESRHGSGTTVRQVTSEALVEPLGWLLQGHGTTLDHLHQVRSILEIEIVKLAAAQATEADIARLRDIVAQMEHHKEDVAAFVALDADFHQALSETTRNPLLAVLLDSIRDLMQEVRLPGAPPPGGLRHGRAGPPADRGCHRGARSGDRRRAMQRHLDHSRTFQREFLASEGEKT